MPQRTSAYAENFWDFLQCAFRTRGRKVAREISTERGRTHGGPHILYLGVAKSMSSFRVMWTRKREATLKLSCRYQTQESSLLEEVHSKRLSLNQGQTSSKDNCVVRRQHALYTHLPQRVIPNTCVLPERQPLGLCHTEAIRGWSVLSRLAGIIKEPQRGKLRKRH